MANSIQITPGFEPWFGSTTRGFEYAGRGDEEGRKEPPLREAEAPQSAEEGIPTRGEATKRTHTQNSADESVPGATTPTTSSRIGTIHQRAEGDRGAAREYLEKLERGETIEDIKEPAGACGECHGRIIDGFTNPFELEGPIVIPWDSW